MTNVAILIPCYNEELTVGRVIKEFKKINSSFRIYVYDNMSTDRTVDVAKHNNAVVRIVLSRGKGYVIQSMFRDIDAECYILIDGDFTYSIESVNTMIELILDGKADMVIGSRLFNNSRLLSLLSSKILHETFKLLFKKSIEDPLSGFRAFSKEFVKSFPATSKGFEVETEMNLHAISKGYRIEYVPTVYIDRPIGSESKLKLIHDGSAIILKILKGFLQTH